MAFLAADRVRETSATTGTGTLTLLGAVTGYQSFSTAIGSGNTTYYTISNQNANEWEVGIGTVGSGTLARTSILSSSNSGYAVDFTAGTKDVFVTYPAGGSWFTNDIGTAPNEIPMSGMLGALAWSDVPMVLPPTSASSVGRVGQIAQDGTYLYVCTAANTWRRVAISSW